MATNNALDEGTDPTKVNEGGTGVATLAAYAPMCGGTTTTGAVQSATTGLSTSGYVLTSNGAAAIPSFQAASGSGLTQPQVMAITSIGI